MSPKKVGFDKRVQYYLSWDYSMQINRGEDYPLLNPAYFIGILDFEFSKSKQYHTRHLILDKATNEHLLKDIEFSFVELPKFLLGLDKLVTPIDKWTYFIKNAEELTFIPDYANEDEGLKVAFVEADKHNWSKDDLFAYDNASIAEQDERGKITAAEKKGKLGVASEMKKEGEPIDKIIKYTGLTADEINE